MTAKEFSPVPAHRLAPHSSVTLTLDLPEQRQRQLAILLGWQLPGLFQFSPVIPPGEKCRSGGAFPLPFIFSVSKLATRKRASQYGISSASRTWIQKE